jgi:putative addiction module killer protein
MRMWTIRHYLNAQGADLFQEWLDELSDRRARARIAARLLRIELGNLGDTKSVGDGVHELRIDYGPGYRVYFAMINKQAVLLCCGGTKQFQRSDIQHAKRLWQEWQQRNS